MFKRVEKRRKRKQEEEELGLDQGVKEILGLNDTDSDESFSDSEISGEEQASDHLDEEESVHESPGISVQDALHDPLYIVSLNPTVKACIICPGKLLKSVKMIQLHLTSNAHHRHFKSFKELASTVDSGYDAWDLSYNNLKKNQSVPSLVASPESSKRSQKRDARAAFQKARREKQKIKAKLKKTVAEEQSAIESITTPANDVPPKKKQKVRIAPSSPPTPAVEPSHKKIESTSITSIVRSASTRAKMARVRSAGAKNKIKPND